MILRLSVSPPVSPHPIAPAPVEAQAAAALSSVAESREFFAGYGLGPEDGNGPIDVELSTEPNAAYAQARSGAEKLVIGQEADTGIPYAFAKDVVAHEYAHRVLSKLGLPHDGEGGTVGESLADTFAAAIERDGEWTIGDDVKPGGVRSMDDPSRPQDALRTQDGVVRSPSDIRDKIETTADDGGVHINVGIPNKAAATIGKVLGIDTMADIYMNAVHKHITPDVDIAGLANATIKSAAELYGAASAETRTVLDAWQGVGFDLVAPE